MWRSIEPGNRPFCKPSTSLARKIVDIRSRSYYGSFTGRFRPGYFIQVVVAGPGCPPPAIRENPHYFFWGGMQAERAREPPNDQTAARLVLALYAASNYGPVRFAHPRRNTFVAGFARIQPVSGNPSEFLRAPATNVSRSHQGSENFLRPAESSCGRQIGAAGEQYPSYNFPIQKTMRNEWLPSGFP